MNTEVLNSSTNPPAIPPTGIKAVLRHVINWLEIYFWVPLVLLAIIGAIKYVIFLTGRHPTEDPNWIVGFAFRLVVIVLAIVFTSVYKQQIGVWLSKEETKLHIPLAIANKVETCIVLLAFIYVLLH